MTTTLPGGVRQLPFDFLLNQRPKWPPNHGIYGIHGIHGIHGLTKEECIDLLFSRHLSRPCGRCGFLTYAEQLVRWAVWDTCGWWNLHPLVCTTIEHQWASWFSGYCCFHIVSIAECQARLAVITLVLACRCTSTMFSDHFGSPFADACNT